MITIKVNDENLSIESEGHAGFAEKGKDIVCAAVTILLYTYEEMLDELEVETDILDDGWFHDIVPRRPWDAGIKAETAYWMAKTGLQMLAEHFRDNLIIQDHY